MSGQLEGRVAVITAGSTGIGFAIAKAFIAEGASVVIANRSADKGQHALDRLNAGDRATFVKCDALVREDVEAAIDLAVEKYGKLDIMVNNAGGSDGWALIADMEPETWLKGMDWNLNSAFWGTRKALQVMLPNGYGRIINMASFLGKSPNQYAVSHYITGKAGMIGLTKAVAFEYGASGITCNAICPGPVETEMMQEAGAGLAASTGASYDDFINGFAAQTLTKKLNTVEECAALALLLAGPQGAGFQGTSINVDAGSSWY